MGGKRGEGGVPSEGEEEESSPVPWIRQEAWVSNERNVFDFFWLDTIGKKLSQKKTWLAMGTILTISSNQGPLPPAGYTLDLLGALTTDRPQEVFTACPLKMDNIMAGQAAPLGSPNSLAVVFKDTLCKHGIPQPQKCPAHPINISTCRRPWRHISDSHNGSDVLLGSPRIQNCSERQARRQGTVSFCSLNTTSGTHRDTRHTDTRTLWADLQASQGFPPSPL